MLMNDAANGALYVSLPFAPYINTFPMQSYAASLLLLHSKYSVEGPVPP